VIRRAEVIRIGRIVDQLLRLSGYGADRKFGAAAEPLDETDDARAEDAGAVVIDQQRDAQRPRRGFRADDLACLPAFLDREVCHCEIRHRRACAVRCRDIDDPSGIICRTREGRFTSQRRHGRCGRQHAVPQPPHAILPTISRPTVQVERAPISNVAG
jgi:hypothetical protein